MKRSRLFGVKHLSAAAMLALLAGCANGFDPIKIVLSPVSERFRQIEPKRTQNTEQPDPDAPQAQPATQVAAATATTITTKPATASKPAAAAKPAAPAKPTPKPAAPLEAGWLYVFETDVAQGACRVADSMRGQVVWDPLKYRQYSFTRSGQLSGSRMREDAKLCAEGDTMRYALVLPQSAPALPNNARLDVAQTSKVSALVRQRFDTDVPLPFAGTTATSARAKSPMRC